MEGFGQRRDIDGFVGTERSTFVNQSGGGGMTADQFINQLMLQGLGLNEVLEIMAQYPPNYFGDGLYGDVTQSTDFDNVGDLLDSLAQQDPYTSAFQTGGTGGLLDALAGNDAGSGGGATGVSPLLDSLADPNDISSGEFGGVDSLLDDLAGSAVGPTTPLSVGDYGTSVPDPLYPPVMSGGGDGMPPPEEPPVMSGGGDRAGCTDELAANFDPSAVVDDGSCVFTGGPTPPPPPPMSGGGDGMPPPPPMSGGGDGMPPPMARRGRRPSVRQRGATRVRSPFPNGSRQALATRAFGG